MTKAFAISIHDVSPATLGACRNLFALLEQAKLVSTLLVVPRYHGGAAADSDPAFVAALRRRVAVGDEVSLHGYLHQDDARAPRTPVAWLRRRVYTASEGEFDALDEAESDRRLQLGQAQLDRLGFAVRSFVAPAWLLGRAAQRSLARTPLAYTSSRDALIRIRDGARVDAPSLVWSTRTRWRRDMSRMWNARRLERLATAPLIRLAMHPADATHPVTMTAWRDTLDVLATSRQCVREFDVIEAQLGR
jgi:predicted deacetylase